LNPSKDLACFEVSNKKIVFGFGFRFFVSDILGGVGFWPFWLRLPGPGPNRKIKVFCLSFYWKLG